jgi:hypothetical protein
VHLTFLFPLPVNKRTKPRLPSSAGRSFRLPELLRGSEYHTGWLEWGRPRAPPGRSRSPAKQMSLSRSLRAAPPTPQRAEAQVSPRHPRPQVWWEGKGREGVVLVSGPSS